MNRNTIPVSPTNPMSNPIGTENWNLCKTCGEEHVDQNDETPILDQCPLVDREPPEDLVVIRRPIIKEDGAFDDVNESMFDNELDLRSLNDECMKGDFKTLCSMISKLRYTLLRASTWRELSRISWFVTSLDALYIEDRKYRARVLHNANTVASDLEFALDSNFDESFDEHDQFEELRGEIGVGLELWLRAISNNATRPTLVTPRAPSPAKLSPLVFGLTLLSIFTVALCAPPEEGSVFHACLLQNEVGWQKYLVMNQMSNQGRLADGEDRLKYESVRSCVEEHSVRGKDPMKLQVRTRAIGDETTTQSPSTTVTPPTSAQTSPPTPRTPPTTEKPAPQTSAPVAKPMPRYVSSAGPGGATTYSSDDAGTSKPLDGFMDRIKSFVDHLGNLLSGKSKDEAVKNTYAELESSISCVAVGLVLGAPPLVGIPCIAGSVALAMTPWLSSLTAVVFVAWTTRNFRQYKIHLTVLLVAFTWLHLNAVVAMNVTKIMDNSKNFVVTAQNGDQDSLLVLACVAVLIYHGYRTKDYIYPGVVTWAILSGSISSPTLMLVCSVLVTMRGSFSVPGVGKWWIGIVAFMLFMNKTDADHVLHGTSFTLDSGTVYRLTSKPLLSKVSTTFVGGDNISPFLVDNSYMCCAHSNCQRKCSDWGSWARFNNCAYYDWISTGGLWKNCFYSLNQWHCSKVCPDASNLRAIDCNTYTYQDVYVNGQQFGDSIVLEDKTISRISCSLPADHNELWRGDLRLTVPHEIISEHCNGLYAVKKVGEQIVVDKRYLEFSHESEIGYPSIMKFAYPVNPEPLGEVDAVCSVLVSEKEQAKCAECQTLPHVSVQEQLRAGALVETIAKIDGDQECKFQLSCDGSVVGEFCATDMHLPVVCKGNLTITSGLQVALASKIAANNLAVARPDDYRHTMTNPAFDWKFGFPFASIFGNLFGGLSKYIVPAACILAGVTIKGTPGLGLIGVGVILLVKPVSAYNGKIDDTIKYGSALTALACLKGKHVVGGWEDSVLLALTQCILVPADKRFSKGALKELLFTQLMLYLVGPVFIVVVLAFCRAVSPAGHVSSMATGVCKLFNDLIVDLDPLQTMSDLTTTWRSLPCIDVKRSSDESPSDELPDVSPGECEVKTMFTLPKAVADGWTRFSTGLDPGFLEKLEADEVSEREEDDFEGKVYAISLHRPLHDPLFAFAFQPPGSSCVIAPWHATEGMPLKIDSTKTYATIQDRYTDICVYGTGPFKFNEPIVSCQYRVVNPQLKQSIDFEYKGRNKRGFNVFKPKGEKQQPLMGWSGLPIFDPVERSKVVGIYSCHTQSDDGSWNCVSKPDATNGDSAYKPHILDALAGKPQNVVRATGTGKTRGLLEAALSSGAKDIILLQPMRKQAQALYESFSPKYGRQIGIKTGAMDARGTHVTIMTYGSFSAKIRPMLAKNPLIIADEWHTPNDDVQCVIYYLENVVGHRRIIKASATPDGTVPFPSKDVEIVELQFDKIKLNGRKLRFGNKDLDIIDDGRDGILVFVPTIQEAESLCRQARDILSTCGVSHTCITVTSKSKDEISGMIDSEIRLAFATSAAESGINLRVKHVVDVALEYRCTYTDDGPVANWVPLTEANRAQRLGRTGRFGPGFYYCGNKEVSEYSRWDRCAAAACLRLKSMQVQLPHELVVWEENLRDSAPRLFEVYSNLNHNQIGVVLRMNLDPLVAMFYVNQTGSIYRPLLKVFPDATTSSSPRTTTLVDSSQWKKVGNSSAPVTTTRCVTSVGSAYNPPGVTYVLSVETRSASYAEYSTMAGCAAAALALYYVSKSSSCCLVYETYSWDQATTKPDTKSKLVDSKRRITMNYQMTAFQVPDWSRSLAVLASNYVDGARSTVANAVDHSIGLFDSTIQTAIAPMPTRGYFKYGTQLVAKNRPWLAKPPTLTGFVSSKATTFAESVPQLTVDAADSCASAAEWLDDFQDQMNGKLSSAVSRICSTSLGRILFTGAASWFSVQVGGRLDPMTLLVKTAMLFLTSKSGYMNKPVAYTALGAQMFRNRKRAAQVIGYMLLIGVVRYADVVDLSLLDFDLPFTISPRAVSWAEVAIAFTSSAITTKNIFTYVGELAEPKTFAQSIPTTSSYGMSVPFSVTPSVAGIAGALFGAAAGSISRMVAERTITATGRVTSIRGEQAEFYLGEVVKRFEKPIQLLDHILDASCVAALFVTNPYVSLGTVALATYRLEMQDVVRQVALNLPAVAKVSSCVVSGKVIAPLALTAVIVALSHFNVHAVVASSALGFVTNSIVTTSGPKVESVIYTASPLRFEPEKIADPCMAVVLPEKIGFSYCFNVRDQPLVCDPYIECGLPLGNVREVCGHDVKLADHITTASTTRLAYLEKVSKVFNRKYVDVTPRRLDLMDETMRCVRKVCRDTEARVLTYEELISTVKAKSATGFLEKEKTMGEWCEANLTQDNYDKPCLKSYHSIIPKQEKLNRLTKGDYPAPRLVHMPCPWLRVNQIVMNSLVIEHSRNKVVPYLNTGTPLMLAGGLLATKKEELEQKYGEPYVYVESDTKAFDTNIRPRYVQLKYDFYRSFKKTDCKRWNALFETARRSAVMPTRVLATGEVLRCQGQVSSGDHDTSFGNGSINVFRFFAVMSEITGCPVQQCVDTMWILAEGDDSVGVVPARFAHLVMSEFDAVNLLYGFPQKGRVNVSPNIESISFCSHTFRGCGKPRVYLPTRDPHEIIERLYVDCELNLKGRDVATLTPEVLDKLYPRTPEDAYSKLLSYLIMYNHMPSIRRLLAVLLERCKPFNEGSTLVAFESWSMHSPPVKKQAGETPGMFWERVLSAMFGQQIDQRHVLSDSVEWNLCNEHSENCVKYETAPTKLKNTYHDALGYRARKTME